MDLVHASLRRRHAVTATAGEVGEVVDVIWAQATRNDGLEHVLGRSAADRLDLLLYFLSSGPGVPCRADAPRRAADILARCYEASTVMRRRYLLPDDASGQDAE